MNLKSIDCCLEDCNYNVAIGAKFKQCGCPNCGSNNIKLDSMISELDFGMTCNNCGEMWDADEQGFNAHICPKKLLKKY